VAEGRYVFDTNVLWHGLLPSDDPVSVTCRRLLEAVDDGEIQAFASTMSLVELPKVIAPPLPLERLVALTETLRHSRIIWIPVDEAIAFRARDIALQQQLAPAYDAVILATAIEIRASRLYTHDREDFPVGETVEGVAVTTPELPNHLAQERFDIDDGP
jgi:predicted nucleic acid-binding protein